MLIGFPRIAKYAQQRICRLKNKALNPTSASPYDRLNDSVMHSKYIPTTPMITAINTRNVFFCFRKTWAIIGTSSIYIAVINPAFPTDVYLMPTCCRLLAINKKKPQTSPPASSVLFSSGVPAAFLFSPLRGNRMQGMSTTPPIRLRTDPTVRGDKKSLFHNTVRKFAFLTDAC